jgi:hypothetical protein
MFAYVSGPFSLWGRLLYFCSSAQNYILAVPKGYKNDLVLLSQISRTLQKKRTRQTDAPSSQKRSDSVSTSKASLQQIVFGLAFLQHNSTLNDCPLASNRPGLYRNGFGFSSPTSSKNLASKNAQYPPKMGEIC